MGYAINNDDLTAYIINESQNVFSKKEQRYIQTTRLNKLIILVSKDLEQNGVIIEDFVWGYYRHGFYSSTVEDYLKTSFGADFNLSQLTQEQVNLPEEVTQMINNCLLKLSQYFVRDRKAFFEWIYGEITPNEYRDFYLTNRELNNWFEEIKDDLMGGNLQMNLFGRKDRNISGIISNYYFSLEHIEDEDILEIFRKFTDLIEFLSIKLNNNQSISQITIKVDSLFRIYKDIFAILTPYIETLHGDRKLVEQEKIKHKNRVQFYKKKLNKDLDELHEQFESEGLIPTINELNKELLTLIKQLPADSPTIRELYEEIEAR
ncbi:MAG: hypothetical protein PQ975_00985 [Methanobacterium sp.]|jgi:hypothetical protein